MHNTMPLFIAAGALFVAVCFLATYIQTKSQKK